MRGDCRSQSSPLDAGSLPSHEFYKEFYSLKSVSLYLGWFRGLLFLTRGCDELVSLSLDF